MVRDAAFDTSRLRILLETDAPYVPSSLLRISELKLNLLLQNSYMVPANIYDSLSLPNGKSNSRLPLSHSGMIPWTAEFVADTVNGANVDASMDANDVLEISRANARVVYGI